MRAQPWFTELRVKHLQGYFDEVVAEYKVGVKLNLRTVWTRYTNQLGCTLTEARSVTGLNPDTAREALKQLELVRNDGGKGSAVWWQINQSFTIAQAVNLYFSQRPLGERDVPTEETIARLLARISNLQGTLRAIATRSDELGEMARAGLM